MLKKFYQAFACNSIESIGYQAILALHHIALYQKIDAHWYGTIGIIFSLIYLCITYINLGLDTSLPRLFAQSIRSRHYFSRMVITQVALNGCVALLFGLLFVIFFSYMATIFNINVTYGPWCPIVLGGIILTESLKKTVRTVLHLAFYNRYTAIIELITICSYVGIIWGCFAIGYGPSLMLIFAPMVLTSALSLCALLVVLAHYYRTLARDPHESIDYKSIVKARVAHTFYQLSHSAYSANFLVPLCAAQYGAHLAGLLKLISMVAYCLNSIISNIFGATTQAVLAQIKHKTLSHKQAVFKKVSSWLFQTALFLLLCMLCNYRLFIHTPLAMQDSIIICLFLLIIFSENFVITHERFFIVEGTMRPLIVCNMLSLIPLYLAKTVISMAPLALLSMLAICRCVGFIGICLYASFYWKIRPAWQIKPLHLSIPLISAILYRLIS